MSSPEPPYRFLYQQDEPQLLCQGTGRVPEEYNAGNRYYGLGDIVCEYAGIKRDGPLPFGMDHAVSFVSEEPHDRDLMDELPTFCPTTRERARAYKAAGTSKAVAIGAVFFYAVHLYERKHGRAPAPRRGTVVFPHKSTVEHERDFDDASFADWLVNLPPQYHPVVVNMYWVDYQRGKHAVYQSRGLQVVSSGHVFDNQFLLRFYDLCRQFRYACSNALTTSFSLSVLSGCQFIYHRTSGHRERYMGKLTCFEEDPTLGNPRAREAAALSSFPPVEGGLGRQLQLARELAGHQYLRWPWTLRWLFSSARNRLLAMRGTGLDFSQPFPRRQFYAWLPRGIDYDGWLRPEAALVLPRSRNHTLLELFLELPGWSNLPGMDVNVLVDDVPLGKVAVVPGITTLNIFLPPGKRDRRVALHAEGRFTMPDGDSRICSARLIRFQLHACMPQSGVTASPVTQS